MLLAVKDTGARSHLAYPKGAPAIGIKPAVFVVVVHCNPRSSVELQPTEASWALNGDRIHPHQIVLVILTGVV
jgi:hypothetical protein